MPALESGLLFLVLLVPLALLCIARLSNRRLRLPIGIVAVTPLFPALLVSGILWWSEDKFGDYVLEVTGLRFQHDPVVNRAVSVGGDYENDHFHVRGLPGGFLTVIPEPGSISVIRKGGAGSQGQGPSRFGLVHMTLESSDSGEDDGVGRFVGAYDVSQARQVVLRIGTAQFVVDPPTRRVWLQDDPSTVFTVPTRTTSFGPLPPLPVWRELGPEFRVHSFRSIARALRGRGAQLGPTPDEGNSAAGSFLYFDGGYFRRNLHLMLLDPDAELEIDGKTHRFEQEETLVDLKPGQSARFRLYRVDYVEDGGRYLRSRIQERRSFTLFAERSSFRFRLDTPYLLRIGRDQITLSPTEGNIPNREPPLRPFTIIGESFASELPIQQALLRLPMVGDPYGPELFSQIRFRERPEVVTHQGIITPDLGQPFQIGDRDAVELRVDRQAWPVGTIAFVWLVALANLALVLKSTSRTDPTVLASLLFVEAMLALRLLVAIASVHLDPTALDQRVAFAFAAYAAVPFLFDRTFTALISKGSVGAFASVPAALLPSFVLAAAIAFPVTVYAHGLWSFPRYAWDTIVVLLVLVLTPPAIDFGSRAARRARIPEFLRRLGRYRWVFVLILILLVARIGAMIGLGWKERISLGGQQVAISVFYTPLLMLAVAFSLIFGHRVPPGPWLMRLARRVKWTSGFARIIAQGFILGLVVFIGAILVPAVVRDIGIVFLYALAVAACTALIGCQGARRPGFAIVAATPLALSIFVLTALPTYEDIVKLTGVDLGTPALAVEEMSPDQAIDYVESQLSARPNTLRLWNTIAPERLREVGTESAENLLVVMKTMQRYVNSGVFGKGYLGVELAPQLRATQANDNVTAVHIIAPFGALGGLALFLAATAWLIALGGPILRPGGPGISKSQPLLTAFGLLCAATVVSACAYMILANLNVVPFTGKNVYFLAALSNSDLIEGTLLVALATWALLRS